MAASRALFAVSVISCVLLDTMMLPAAATSEVDAIVSTIAWNTTAVADIADVSSTGDLLCVSANTNSVYHVTPSSSSTGQSVAWWLVTQIVLLVLPTELELTIQGSFYRMELHLM
ncbi:Hypothetical protein, putative [Bodo saltans]|uniref:Membrane-associated protein n=1 Tax=Bodo saltans TaxID=75058 RepID=A0A0S4JNY5_BODSA|nr:Hypothetical protein, putative [Bodo saltans]|eukprot:CUG93228.1 Hypothetical protein, putative [Bodo saltans]